MWLCFKLVQRSCQEKYQMHRFCHWNQHTNHRRIFLIRRQCHLREVRVRRRFVDGICIERDN